MRALVDRVRRWRPSVRVRVTAAAVLLIAGGLLIAAIIVSSLVHRSLASDYDSLLIDRVDEVELLTQDGQLGPVIAATNSETGQLQVVDATHKVVAATNGLAQSSR